MIESTRSSIPLSGLHDWRVTERIHQFKGETQLDRVDSRHSWSRLDLAGRPAAAVAGVAVSLSALALLR